MTGDLFQDEEGATALTHEERLGLIPSYITQRRELNEVEQINVTEGERWAFSRTRNVLDVDFLRKLHKQMFGEVWRWAGDYSKERNRRLGSDDYQIPIDLHGLMGDAQAWMEFKAFSPDETAVRFHHRLTQIHPFPNGNGRFSRTAGDLFITQLGGQPFSWGRVNLVDPGATGRAYIDALRAADHHILEPLLAFARS